MTQALDTWSHFQIVADTRERDHTIRKQAPGVAIINLTQLINELATTGPQQFRTRAERRAYLEAIKEIAWTARNCTLDHQLSTGDLYPAPGIIAGLNTALVDQLMEQHQ